MKKFTVIILTAILLITTLAIPASAAPTINDKLDAEYIETAPRIDGKIGSTEYGLFPALTYSEDKARFQASDDHDDYNNWDFDFYIAWDEDNLYMAWDVKTNVHQPLVKGTYSNNGDLISRDWPSDGSMLGYMWMFSCVEFIITPGAPKNGSTNYSTSPYSGNYLEVGFCQLDDGSVGRIAWSYPKGISASDISLNSWDAEVARTGNHTIYEIAIPWKMSGIKEAGSNKQFGLTFAVSAQEDYNIKKGMIEWNDAILGGKAADKAGVITLKGATCEFPENPNIITEGARPADSNGKVIFDIDYVNESLTGETTALQTKSSYDINNKWAYSMLLEPVPGKTNVYKYIEGRQGDGATPSFSQYKNGMLVFSLHSDGGSGSAEKDAAINLPIGTELKLWGVDVAKGKLTYSNAMLYVVSNDSTDLPNESEEISDYTDESTDVETSAVPDKNNNNDNNYDDGNSIDDSYQRPTSVEESNSIMSLLPILIVIGAIFIPLAFIVTLVLVLVLGKKKK